MLIWKGEGEHPSPSLEPVPGISSRSERRHLGRRAHLRRSPLESVFQRARLAEEESLAEIDSHLGEHLSGGPVSDELSYGLFAKSAGNLNDRPYEMLINPCPSAGSSRNCHRT